MIRPLDISLLDSTAQAKPATPAQADVPTSGKNAFSSHLKKAADTAASEKPADTTASSAFRVTPPEDEKWRPVKDHDDYAEIISGDRKGQFVNLNRGGRKGEAFTIEEQDGKTYHVYKRDGQDDLKVEVPQDAAARKAGTPKSAPPKGETWAPVTGHSSYADIVSGTRNGYFVNISQGSSREGEAFHIVKKGGKEFHVYGSGKDQVEVEVGATKKKADTKSTSGTTATDSTATTNSTQTTSGAADTRDASTTTGGTTAGSTT